jgi:hypothetical protein
LARTFTVPRKTPVADLQDFDGEPRVQDLRIGERARLSRARDVRQVIKNNEAEFLRYGPLRARTANDTGGRPATEYWLNEGQTLLLFTKLKGDVPADAPQLVDDGDVLCTSIGSVMPTQSFSSSARRDATSDTFAIPTARHTSSSTKPGLQDGPSAVRDFVALETEERDGPALIHRRAGGLFGLNRVRLWPRLRLLCRLDRRRLKLHLGLCLMAGLLRFGNLNNRTGSILSPSSYVNKR